MDAMQLGECPASMLHACACERQWHSKFSNSLYEERAALMHATSVKRVLHIADGWVCGGTGKASVAASCLPAMLRYTTLHCMY